MKAKGAVLFISALVLVAGCQSIRDPSNFEGVTEIMSKDWDRFVLLDRYKIMNNAWNVGASVGKHSQEIFKGSSDGKDFFGWSWDWNGKGQDVLAYPEVGLGSSPWSSEFGTAPEFPFKAATRKVTVTFDVELKATGKYDMAFDINVASRMPNVAENFSHEIMIWNVNASSSDWGWARKLGSPTIDGVTFDVYEDPNHSDVSGGSTHTWTNVIFLARQRVLKATWHIDQFIDFLISIGTLTTDHYVCDVEFGNEVWWGTGLVKIYDYSVAVE